MVTAAALDLRAVVAGVVDPEIPVLTIEDLGILRSVEEDSGRVVVTITPTYSGCPAMRQIEDDIEIALRSHGVDDFEIRVSHLPAWSTDWLTDAGREKLAAFGIAPPTPAAEVICPRCDSARPRMIARFGSTACKALMVCSSCGEPFDYFKQF
ncbi:MAG TPA: 1,2-phenylacetyl-CoA epoxidase subunit PaaD [Acidimicrobiia bacterium]